nr:DUF1223 domain-containing protein [Flavobacterium sp. ASV13]
MKNLNLFPVFTSLVFILTTSVFGQKRDQKNTVKGFVVLEYFSPEGDQSDALADAFLNKIQKEDNGSPLYVLSYRLDSEQKEQCNDLTQTNEFIKRKDDYGKLLNFNANYTPQVVINGRLQYKGSQDIIVRCAIRKVLSDSAVVNLSLKAIQRKNTLRLNYQVKGNSASSRLLIAIVQKKANSSLRHNEKSDQNVSHIQIVANLQNGYPASEEGTTVIPLPENYKSKNFEFIGIHTGVILGASKAGLVAKWVNLDFAIFPVGDVLTMGIEDAIEAAKMVQTDTVIGVHFDTFGFIQIDRMQAITDFKNAGMTLYLPSIGSSVVM